jgi:phosphoglycolate phosphatase
VIKQDNHPAAAFLFDLDGTIIDSMGALENALVSIVQSIGGTINASTKKLVADIIASNYNERHKSLLEAVLVWRIGRILNLSPLKRLYLLSQAHKILAKISLVAPLLPDVRRALTLLREKKCKMALVTMRKRREALAIVERHQLTDFFTAVIAREDAKEIKPSAAPIIEAASKLNVPLSSCVFIGDMPTDIESGQRADIITIGILTGIFGRLLLANKPDFVLEKWADFFSCLPKVEKKLAQRRRGIKTAALSSLNC